MSTGVVYIVDDDAAVRASTAFFLSSVGFTTAKFADGTTFLEEAHGLEPGCVLLDVRMPRIDGLEVLAEMGRRRLQFPVVVMTGHGDITTAVRAMQLGAADFVEKPFDEEMVLTILGRAFAGLDDSVRSAIRCRDAERRLALLSQREREVLDGLIAGRANKVLAFELGISVRTIEMHRAGMMDRLGVRTFAEALRLAFDAGAVLGDVTPPSTARNGAIPPAAVRGDAMPPVAVRGDGMSHVPVCRAA